ncbi:hypothetical protein A4S02_10445 [Acetobacter ascendens]|uniref:Uncharacterized protein n=1 Tax=Acetobacter ascendens TaxID=481146 RepID=A0A1D8QXQ5_9PROT|nr:hypothetical protein [Acetobacter ascendens]AOW47110.1 hypothetical protein A4S02_10445 [Acetobacter ascendens]
MVDVGGGATSKSFISMHSSESTNDNDVQFSASGGTAGESGQGHLEIDALGGILLKGIVQMYGMTKADILATTSPVEGMTVYDTDDHEEVTYRCPTTTTCGWFPVQYGAALSN